MKQVKAKPDAKPARQARCEGPTAPTDLNALREQIRNLVGSEAVQMVESTIAKANSGHCAAMKYLFEMIGLYPATVDPEEAAPDDPSPWFCCGTSEFPVNQKSRQ
ncbi:MAG: hypothetical protein JOY93_07180 [Acidobacteriales bacterium]|nr:hypothetical protein [Terriglobales bacterium]